MGRKYGVVAYLDRDDYMRVKAIAKDSRESVSHVARDLIRSSLTERGKPK